MSETTDNSQAGGRCAPALGSVYFPLFKHMAENHGLTLMDSEMEDICRVVEKMRREPICQWGSCTAPATHRDKTGLLLCSMCMVDAGAYTCGIVPLSPNTKVSNSRK